MKHPAVTLKFFVIAVVATVVGVVLVGMAVDGPALNFMRVLGFVLLAIALINFAVHAVAVLMYDHEMWRSSHFAEVIETED
ncbi:hypothetical protein ABT297_27170 [Dactylosporangium sp. NPDC000555]|uniref:hypothetical protein n=1 Tax=Dactylosporangium sp. NPDC000555 TaxID=3154260 RepID=UPI00331F1FCF